jgi:protein SCO1/2
MRGKTALLLMIAGLALAALALRLSVRSNGTPLPIFDNLPEFTLTSQDSLPFHLSDLKQSATIVYFFFTRCMGPCPMMALEMGKLQSRFADSTNICFISISVDPRHDQPTVLRDYAELVDAMPGRWLFFTGDGDSIMKLSEEGFKLPASTWPVSHSTQFVLVDRFGRIRGYYESTEPKAMEDLVKDIGRLLRSKER